jgi:hypothetical protein
MKRILLSLGLFLIVVSIIVVSCKKEQIQPKAKTFAEAYADFNTKYIPDNGMKIKVTPQMMQEVYEINNLYGAEKHDPSKQMLGWCWIVQCLNTSCSYSYNCNGSGCHLIAWCGPEIAKCPVCGGSTMLLVGSCSNCDGLH